MRWDGELDLFDMLMVPSCVLYSSYRFDKLDIHRKPFTGAVLYHTTREGFKPQYTYKNWKYMGEGAKQASIIPAVIPLP